MAWTFCTSGAAIAKAGSRANSTITASGATLQLWSDEIEGLLCAKARHNLITNYTTLTANGKSILGHLETAMIANKIVNYDVLAYGNNREAELILDVLENDIRRGLAMLEDDNVLTFLGAV